MNTDHPRASVVVDNYPAARRSLRVAFVTETYPPEVNGVAITIACIVEGLHRRNHDVQLVRPRQDGAEQADGADRFDEVLTRGLPIPRYPHLRMGVPSKRALVNLWSMRRPDVVHIATEGPLGWSALQAALHLKLPVCSDFRTNFHAYSKHYGISWLHRPIMGYLRKFHNRTARTMVPTEALRRELESRGFQRLAVVARGVDTQRFNPNKRSAALRDAWGVWADDLVVTCVGRLAPEKNLGVLLSTFEAIRARDSRARLVVIGDGPMRDELRQRCPKAVFAGQRTGEDLAAHYASADLFVFPSLTETFGNVTTEALASGLPLVAFNYAAAAQLVRTGRNGVLAPLADTATFISRAVELATDPARRREIGLRARASAEPLSWDDIVGRFESVLTSVIHEAEETPELGYEAAHFPAV